MAPSDDTQHFLVLNLSLISYMSLSKCPPCVKWAMEPALWWMVLAPSCTTFLPSATPPSQQTVTLFCDCFASSFPNVHQIKELLGHGRTCLWGRISFKVTVQPELTLLVFILCSLLQCNPPLCSFSNHCIFWSAPSCFLKVITAPILEVNSVYSLRLLGLEMCSIQRMTLSHSISCKQHRLWSRLQPKWPMGEGRSLRTQTWWVTRPPVSTCLVTHLSCGCFVAPARMTICIDLLRPVLISACFPDTFINGYPLPHKIIQVWMVNYVVTVVLTGAQVYSYKWNTDIGFGSQAIVSEKQM